MLLHAIGIDGHGLARADREVLGDLPILLAALHHGAGEDEDALVAFVATAARGREGVRHREIETAQVAEERPTSGETVNAYKETKKGYGSSATLKAAPTAWDHTGTGTYRGKKATISSDFTAK